MGSQETQRQQVHKRETISESHQHQERKWPLPLTQDERQAQAEVKPNRIHQAL